ncbi:MAG: thioredoxin family protein [Cytophagales bacterium]|nr:thioredoxin family protein [Bernardetiaceae bacterium]MDW8205358.1 thioredoxin family protein [Cytophagales bacterium]
MSLVCFLSHAQTKSIHFQSGSFEAIIAQAQQANKYVFVDVYTDWCAPCKKLEKEVFTNPHVADFFNQNFINFKINAEKGEGIEFSAEFEVNAYPCALFFSPEGKLVHRTVGYFDAQAFIENGKNALLPERQIISLTQKYQSGDRSEWVLRNYAYALLAAGDGAAVKVARELLEQLTPAQWHQPANWELIRKIELHMDSPIFSYVAKNPQLFAPYEPEYSTYIHLVTGRAMFMAGRSQKAERLLLLKQTLKYYLPQDSARYLARADFYFYTMGNHHEKKHAAAARYLDRFCNDWQELNEMAWHYYEQEHSEELLRKALQWTEKSIQLHKTYQNLDTQAHLLYKLGEYQAAANVARQAIDLGKKQGMDTTMCEELLYKITRK